MKTYSNKATLADEEGNPRFAQRCLLRSHLTPLRFNSPHLPTHKKRPTLL